MALIALFLFAPLPLTILFQYVRPWGAWVRTGALAGFETSRACSLFSWNALRHAEFQKSCAAKFDAEFAGRTGLIFLTNETYFRLFKICLMKSAGLVVGKEGTLYEAGYVEEYCLRRTQTVPLSPLARDLKRLQEACQRTGTAFVVLISPSKAAIYPEYIPDSWMRRYDPRPRAYEDLVASLRREGVHYVDGHAITAEAKSHAPAPVFPKGGTHWSQYAAWLTTNAMIASLQSQGRPLRPVEYEALKVSDRPTGEDADILALLNLAVPWRYPVAELKIKQAPGQDPRPTLAISGGSFVWKIAHLLNDSRQCSEIDFYSYYKTYKTAFANGAFKVVAVPVKSVDFKREIYAADCLVLEVNEATLCWPTTTRSFVDDALEHAPDGQKPKAQFRYELPTK